MKLKFLLALIFTGTLVSETSAQFNIKRICTDDVVNSIQLFLPNDTCEGFDSLVVYGKEQSEVDYEKLFKLNLFSTSIEHTPNANAADWEYYIVFYYRCNGNLIEVESDRVEVDDERPEASELDSVSVIDSTVFLGWKVNDAEDTKGYYVYTGNKQQFRVFDTVKGRFNTSYTDEFEGDPNLGPENYKIAAFDSCDRSSPLGIENHRTIFVEGNIDSCTGILNLEWTPYIGWESETYVVIIKFTEADSLVRIEDGSGNTNFSESGFDVVGDYEIKVRSKSTDGRSSTSNLIVIRNGIINRPNWTYMRSSINNTNEVIVKFSVDTTNDLDNFIIERSESGIDWQEVGGIDFQVGKYTYDFRDEEGVFDSISYSYRLRTFDACNIELEQSNVINTIVADYSGRTGSGIIGYNFYSGWRNDVGEYKLLAGRGEGIKNLVDENSNDLNNFDVQIQNSDTLELPNCYKVMAIEEQVNDYGFLDTSLSNEVCVYEDPIIYIPNAFVPRGTNNNFKVEGLFINEEKSRMTIFNRWGSLVAEISNVESGWDGKKDGKILPGGNYVYIIEIVGDNQRKITRKGSVTLIE